MRHHGRAATVRTPQIQRRRRRGKIPRGTTPRGPRALDQLWPREKTIVELMAEGRRVAGIATALQISPGTVHVVRHTLYRRFGVSGAIDLLRLFYRFEAIPGRAPLCQCPGPSRERAIVGLMAEGHCVESIANQLDLGERTIQQIRSALYKRLAVKGALGLITHFYRLVPI